MSDEGKRCVCCGRPIPGFRQLCPECEKAVSGIFIEDHSVKKKRTSGSRPARSEVSVYPIHPKPVRSEHSGTPSRPGASRSETAARPKSSRSESSTRPKSTRTVRQPSRSSQSPRSGSSAAIRRRKQQNSQVDEETRTFRHELFGVLLGTAIFAVLVAVFIKILTSFPEGEMGLRVFMECIGL